MNIDSTVLKDLMSELVLDLRRRRLLPVVALMLAALVAIPVLLSDSSNPQPVALHASPGGSAPATDAGGAAPGVDAAAATAATEARRQHASGSLRNPFAQSATAGGGTGGTSTATAAAIAGATGPASTVHPATGAGSAPPAATAPAASSSPTAPAGVRTVTRTVTVRVPTPTPKPLYTAYAPRLAFGQTGGDQRRASAAPRFAVFPSRTRVAAIFLGLLADHRGARFLISNRAAVTGDGRCAPSRTHCLYLTLRPHEEELILFRDPTGGVSEYALRYAELHVSRGTSRPAAPQSAFGRHLVGLIEKLLPSLRTEVRRLR